MVMGVYNFFDVPNPTSQVLDYDDEVRITWGRFMVAPGTDGVTHVTITSDGVAFLFNNFTISGGNVYCDMTVGATTYPGLRCGTAGLNPNFGGVIEIFRDSGVAQVQLAGDDLRIISGLSFSSTLLAEISGDGINPFQPSSGVTFFKIHTFAVIPIPCVVGCSPIPLCDQIYATIDGGTSILTWVSSTLVAGTPITTLGQPWTLAFNSSGLFFVAESLFGDHAFIEEFSGLGVSLGELVDLTATYGIDSDWPIGIAITDDDNIWVLGYTTGGGALVLARMDSTGGSVSMWSVGNEGLFGGTLCLDIGKHSGAYTAYYSEGGTQLWAWSVAGGTQLTSPIILGGLDAMGPFRLIIGAGIGGAIALVNDGATHIYAYDRSGAFVVGMPIDISGNLETGFTRAICWGEASNLLWAYRSGATLPDPVLTKVNANIQEAVAEIILPPGTVVDGLASCTTELGEGFFTTSGVEVQGWIVG